MRRVALGLVSLFVLSAACNIDDPQLVTAPATEKAPQAIFGGTPDNSNQATVYLQGMENGQGYACSGTIIAVNQGTGYVLTAGHCVAGQVQLVVIGNNAQTGEVHQATEQWQHPNFNSQNLDYDFGMVAFSGANASTPIVPAAQLPDPVATSGSIVELSGFGLTENGPTTQRMHVNVTTNPLNGEIDDETLKMGYDQSNGKGACNGDSGGPAYFGSGPSRVVAGVTSYGDQNCQQFGVSGRVAAVYTSFILPILNGMPPQQTCDSCANSSLSQGGSCASTVTACENNTSCAALGTCLQNCMAGDDACVQTCANTNPNGIDLYNAIVNCAYCTACSTICPQTDCNASTSVTTAATTGTGNPSSVTSTGAGTPSGAGGAGSSATTGSSGSRNNTGGTDDGSVTVTKCACSVAERSDSGGALAGIGSLAMLGLALSARRKSSALRA